MNIIPFTSIGEWNFTDSRTVLREKINAGYETGVNEFGDDKEYYDYFPELEMLVYYDAADRVNAFEFTSPGPEYRDIDLLSETYNDLLRLFKAFDPQLEISDDSFESAQLGMLVNASDPDDLPESVLVYRKGYYEE